MSIILHDYWRSSSAYRIRIALNLLGLGYDSIPVDLTKGAQTGAYNLAQNRQGLVPTLAIDGQTLTQSLAILEYLNEGHAAGFLPVDPIGRARVRALAYAVAMDIQPVCNLRVVTYVTKSFGGAISTETWMRQWITIGFHGVEAMLDHPVTGPYCHGGNVTIADLCLMPQIYNAQRWGLDLTQFPRISEIGEALASLPAVAAAHPDRVRPVGPQ